jgi:hypothetical protein
MSKQYLPMQPDKHCGIIMVTTCANHAKKVKEKEDEDTPKLPVPRKNEKGCTSPNRDLTLLVPTTVHAFMMDSGAFPKLILCLRNVIFLLKTKNLCSFFCKFAKLDIN